MAKSGKITLRQIAERVGCSAAAVSYALNRSHVLSEELRSRIWRAADELGYCPYGAQSGNSIVPVAVLGAATAGMILKYFHEELARRNMTMQLYYLPEKIDWRDFGNRVAPLLNTAPRPAGIITLHPDINSFDLLKYCKNIPSVIYYREGSMCSRVIVKLEEIGKLAAQRILRTGCRQAGFAVIQETESVHSDRVFRTIQELLGRKRPGFRFTKIRIAQNRIPSMPDQLYADGCRVFCTHGAATPPMLQWAYATKRRIPDDLSIFCIDYENIAEQSIPPLSAVALPHRELVQYTVDELCARLRHTQPELRELFPFFIDRGTIIG